LVGVLHEQHDIALRDSFGSRIDLRLKNFSGRDAVVVIETIRRFHFRAHTGGGNAEIRIASVFIPESLPGKVFSPSPVYGDSGIFDHISFPAINTKKL